jgi:hypothetical protein
MIVFQLCYRCLQYSHDAFSSAIDLANSVKGFFVIVPVQVPKPLSTGERVKLECSKPKRWLGGVAF